MTITVEAEIGAAARIVAAVALHAVFDAARALGLVGDDGAEQQTADHAGRDRAIVPTAIAAIIAAAAPVPYLDDQ